MICFDKFDKLFEPPAMFLRGIKVLRGSWIRIMGSRCGVSYSNRTGDSHGGFVSQVRIVDLHGGLFARTRIRDSYRVVVQRLSNGPNKLPKSWTTVGDLSNI